MACLTRAGTWLSYLFSHSGASPRGAMEVLITTTIIVPVASKFSFSNK